jgi:DNA-binding NarL/FixJ family response regulator
MDKIRVLLVEDHVVVRESIRQSLTHDSGLEVVGEAGNGEEAVDMALCLKPDVIIMDIAMPGLNGIEATRKIRQDYPTAVILALTAYDYEQYIFPLLEAGAAGYLLKDISSEQLIDAIRTVHRGEAVLHPTVTRKVLERFSRNTK